MFVRLTLLLPSLPTNRSVYTSRAAKLGWVGVNTVKVAGVSSRLYRRTRTRTHSSDTPRQPKRSGRLADLRIAHVT